MPLPLQLLLQQVVVFLEAAHYLVLTENLLNDMLGVVHLVKALLVVHDRAVIVVPGLLRSVWVALNGHMINATSIQ